MLTIRKTSLSAAAALAAVVLCTPLVGCKEDTKTDGASENAESSKNKTDSAGGHEGHDHPSEGPHGGQLIELGNEEYHGELLHEKKTHTVTIYILDSKAKTEVPVATDAVKLNVSVNGKPASHAMKAVGAKDKMASQFIVEDAALVHAFDEGKATNGKLSVTIKGKPYVGKIEHKPHDDHEGHDHGDGHDDHEHHEDDKHDHDDHAHDDHD